MEQTKKAAVGCVIMASGRAVRFGSNKLLADFGGAPLIAQALDVTETPALAARVVVTRSPEVAELACKAGVKTILHSLPGRNDTVRLGLETLLSELPGLAGCIFLPGDQPLLRKESLEEAWQLNQKRPNRVLGGMIWLKMENINVGTAIDLSGLGLDKIEETAEGFSIGAMVPLRQIELHEELNAYTEGAVRESVRHIVGVQLRNLATVGGSIYSRFGFSDVLTMFLALNASVELYKGGIVPLSEYAQRPYDRDILVRVIVPKEQAAFCYQSVRNSQTDFPVLTCAAAKTAGGFRLAIGARPGKAVLYTLQPNAAETPELTAARFAAEVRANIRTESNMRGSAEYRNHLAGVLVKRAVLKLEGNR